MYDVFVFFFPSLTQGMSVCISVYPKHFFCPPGVYPQKKKCVSQPHRIRTRRKSVVWVCGALLCRSCLEAKGDTERRDVGLQEGSYPALRWGLL